MYEQNRFEKWIRHGPYRVLWPFLLVLSYLLVSEPSNAMVLDFDSVLQQATAQSVDLKIARANIEISRHRLDETRSLYYPSFDFQLYNEYVQVPDENVQGVVSVGTSVSTVAESTYQNSVVASINYDLYDFGARALKHANARREVDIARHHLDRSRVDLQIQVLEAYARGLQLWRRLTAERRVMDLRKEIYRDAQQLKEAGTVGRRQVEAFALELAEVLARSDGLAIEYQNALNELTYFTKEPYSAERTGLRDFAEPDREGKIPKVRLLPEIRAIEAEIDNKRAEVEIARIEMLPRLVAYGAYRMYGNDTNAFLRSLKNLTERDTTVAVVAEWNLFSGFRDQSKVRRLQAEIQRLSLEKEKREAELERDIRNSHQAHRFIAIRDDHWQKRRSWIKRSRETDSRLYRRQLIDRIAYLDQEIDLVRHKLDLDLQKIDQASAGLKLKFWREGQVR